MRPVSSIVRFSPIGVPLLALLALAWLMAFSTAAAGGPAQNVCDGKVQWDNWSWGSDVKVEGARYYDKKPALQLAFNQDWAGVSFAADGFETKGYKDLRFMMHHNGGPIPALQAGLHDHKGDVIKYVPVINHAKMIDGGWLYVSIPLDKLGAEGKKITRVTLQQRHQSTTHAFNIASLGFGKDGKDICLIDIKDIKKDVKKDRPTDGKDAKKDEKKDLPVKDGKKNFVNDGKDGKKDKRDECPVILMGDKKGPANNNAGNENLSAYVFDGKLQWEDRSWDTKLCIQSDGPKYNAKAPLSVKYTAPWAGLSFRTDGFISGYNNLEFAMHANGGPVPSLRAVVYDNSGEIGMVRVANYITGMDKGWYKVSIPLKDLGADGKEVVRVTLQEGRGIVPQTFLVNDVRFTWP